MSLRNHFAIAAACGVVAMLLTCALAGCASSNIATMEPKTGEVSVESASSLTEESQKVTVTIPFDEAIADTGDVKVAVDGKEADSKTVACDVQAQGSDLVVTLTPGSAAGTTNTGSYFALYQGRVEVSGGVLASPVNVIVPSGMKLKTISKSAGKTVVEVTQFAQIRCCTWFAVGDERFYMHHHQFAQETCESCAAAFAEQLNNDLAGKYSARAKGSRVTISANDESKFDVSILEGADAQV